MLNVMLALAVCGGTIYTGDSNMVNCYLPNTVAVGGATTATYLNYQDQVIAKRPDRVVIMIGTNDAFQGTDFYGNYPIILDRYRQSGVSVVLATVLPVQGAPVQENVIEGYNAYIRGLGYPVIDTWTDIQKVTGWQNFYDSIAHLWHNGGYDWLRAELTKNGDTIYMPEPSGLFLLISGLLLVGGIKWMS